MLIPTEYLVLSLLLVGPSGERHGVVREGQDTDAGVAVMRGARTTLGSADAKTKRMNGGVSMMMR